MTVDGIIDYNQRKKNRAVSYVPKTKNKSSNPQSKSKRSKTSPTVKAKPEDIMLSTVLKKAAAMSRTLEKNLEEKNHELAEKNQQLDRLNETLAGKEQMIELLQREQSRKAEIALNVIAEQLRSEYREFRTALDLPMDVDLGENMRLQLKKLFTILERNGVNFD